MAYLGEVSLGGTITAPFLTADTTGAAADFTNATASVRVCGTTASNALAPITAGVNTYLLSHASFPPGCGEVEIAATEANGYTASQWYSVYATATVGTVVSGGALGKFLVTTASKRTYDAAARVMDALEATGAKIASGQTISTASNAGSVGTVLGTVNAEVVTKTGFSLAADQSAVTIGTASKVGGFTTPAKAELQTEAADALTAHDFTAETFGTASNAPSAAAIANAIGQRVPDGTSDAGSFDWTIGLGSGRLKDVETATAATTATRTLYKPNGTESWGTYVVNTSASGVSYIIGTSDS